MMSWSNADSAAWLWLMMPITLIAAGAAAALVVREYYRTHNPAPARARTSPSRSSSGRSSSSVLTGSSLVMLQRRLAAGEIDVEQYERLRRLITASR